jgi:hypothetical protein
MSSSGMLHRVALVRTDVSEGRIASIIKVTRFLGVRRLLVTPNLVPSSRILVALMMEAICPSETSVPTRAARHSIPEHGILQCYTGLTRVDETWGSVKML